MNKFFLVGFLLMSGYCFSQEVEAVNPRQNVSPAKFSLDDFLIENRRLDAKVDSIYNALDDTSRVAQLIMPAIGKYGQPKATIDYLVKNRLIGGLLLLNGTKEECTSWVVAYNKMNKQLKTLPFLYSADAEPTLVNRKIIGSTPVKKANQITTIDEVNEVATTISKDLLEIGINYNFAPVLDMSSNATVGYRGFGANPENITPWSNAFIATTQSHNILATAKHFPGHGLVSGDTHKALQMIDGELKEVKYYPPTIKAGVASIMIGHLAVKNNPEFNTEGMPATTSSKIVTDLLRDSLGFKGLIVTDAMNMGGVASVVNANVLTVSAGCDILLMPLDAEKAHKEILSMYQKDPAFKLNVEAASKRVIRSKICLGLIP